jgi:hypothetical protein
MDISLKDDVTVIFLLSVSFIFMKNASPQWHYWLFSIKHVLLESLFQRTLSAYAQTYSHRVLPPLPPLLATEKAGSNNHGQVKYPPLPIGIGELYNPNHISYMTTWLCGAIAPMWAPLEAELWTKSVLSLYRCISMSVAHHRNSLMAEIFWRIYHPHPPPFGGLW